MFDVFMRASSRATIVAYWYYSGDLAAMMCSCTSGGATWVSL